MSNSIKPPLGKPFQVDLDSEVLTWPGRSLGSILEMFAHLESLAARRGRDSFFNAERDVACAAHTGAGGKADSGLSPHGRIRFRQLGRQVIHAAKAQVELLRMRTQEVQCLVLINDWPVAERLWQELLFECRTPLLGLNFLEELWGIRPDRVTLGGWSLAPHWHQFVLIQAEVEILLARRRSLAELSDAVGRHLGHWLKRFADILEKLDEDSAS